MANPTSPSLRRISVASFDEEHYALNLKMLPSAIQMLNSKQQREIKKALREIDDLLYTLICAQNEQAQASYLSANNPPEPPPATETQAQADTRPARGKISK